MEKEEHLELTPEQEYDIALRKIKFGQIVIFVLAALSVAAAVTHAYYLPLTKFFLVLYALLFLSYTLLGIFYYQNPFEISITALCIFIAILLITSSLKEVLLFWFAIPDAFIIIALSTSISHGNKYKKAKARKASTDVLDDDLL